MIEIKTLWFSTPTAWCDNISVGSLASNAVFHNRTKHIEIDVHFVREQVAAKKLKMHYVSSQHQVANILIRQLPIPIFKALKERLNVIE